MTKLVVIKTKTKKKTKTDNLSKYLSHLKTIQTRSLFLGYLCQNFEGPSQRVIFPCLLFIFLRPIVYSWTAHSYRNDLLLLVIHESCTHSVLRKVLTFSAYRYISIRICLWGLTQRLRIHM